MRAPNKLGRWKKEQVTVPYVGRRGARAQHRVRVPMRRGTHTELLWIRPPAAVLRRVARERRGDPLVEAVGRVGVPQGPPGLSPAREAALLLRTAAEVEHSLLVQYLYAAFSVETDPRRFRGARPPDTETGGPLVQDWQHLLARILAVQEMAHLVTVQNLLRVLKGGRPHFDRQDYPARTGLYPFPFRLEPLTRTSLAKYATAEMPVLSHLTFEQREVARLATGAAGAPVNHVGVIYARLHFLFQPDDRPHPSFAVDPRLFPPGHIADADLDFAAARPYQSVPEEWSGLSVDDIVLPVDDRAGALRAICAVAVQGEGVTEGGACGGAPVQPSHFERFLKLYREFTQLAGPTKWIPARDVPVNPNTTQPSLNPLLEMYLRRGRITQPQVRLVAKVQNVRYWALLAKLWHGLNLPCAGGGGLATRPHFLGWAVQEMKFLGVLSRLLTELPRRTYLSSGNALLDRAAAPFELPPNTQALFPPIPSPAGWGIHRALIDRYRKLTGAPIQMPSPELQARLDEILELFREFDEIVLEKLPPSSDPAQNPGPA